ncbi:MAG: hypothetical protein NT024_05820 [Proteobacteria bacterium]|nr:hypothetical protein [Pseudomonadota bacterium]
MSDKPSYLKVLNTIANGEARGYALFDAWAKTFESAFGYGRERGDEGLGGIFNDTSIDPVTGALLGRFIAEERDTTRRLQAAYERVRVTSVDDSGLEQISQRLERLTKTIEELKAMRQDRR